MVLHMPWTRNLGAPRVQFEIAEEFVKLGHHVDKFDIHDAFPRSNRLTSFFHGALFPKRAAQFVRQYGHKYDVIDAHQANLPFSKQELKFEGLLCARSCGLGHFFFQYEQEAELARRREKRKREGSLAGNAVRWVSKQLGPSLDDYEKSFACADLINALNQDEFQFVTERLGWKDKTVWFPHGLTDERFAQFDAHTVQPEKRLAEQQIVFIGYFDSRKGSRDFARIVRLTRQTCPNTRFLLLGTGHSPEFVLNHFDECDRAYVTVIPSFDQADLSTLLSNATLGIFPSYCEGFGWAVLEKLAAGVPVIAYDIPGVRETLKFFPEPMMVKPGDTTVLAQRVLYILQLSQSDYTGLSSKAHHIANQFRGRDIAIQLLEVYQRRLKQLGKL